MTNIIAATLAADGLNDPDVGPEVYIRCTTIESFAPYNTGTFIRCASGDKFIVVEPVEFIGQCVLTSSIQDGHPVRRYDPNETYKL